MTMMMMMMMTTKLCLKLKKIALVVGRVIITLSVHICVQHDGREASRRAGLSAVAETYNYLEH